MLNNMIIGEEKNNKFPAWLLWTAIIFFVILILAAGAYFIFEKNYQGRIYPGVYMGNINLGGKKINDAKKLLDEKVDYLNEKGINFIYKNNKTTIYPIISSLEGDIAYSVITIDSGKALEAAANFGRDKNNNFISNLIKKLNAYLYNDKLFLNGEINAKEIKKILVEKFSLMEAPPQDAKLTYKKVDYSGNELIEFEITREKNGETIDYESALSQLNYKISSVDFSAVELASKNSSPKIYKKDCLNLDAKAENMLAAAPFTLKYDDDNKWEITKTQLAGWLDLNINPNYEKNSAGNEKIIIGFNSEEAKKFLNEEVSAKINKNPIEAKFEMKDGKVAEFQAGTNGLELDIDSTLSKIESGLTELNGTSTKEITLVVKEIKTYISVGNTNDVGIREIIGTGESNFKGSPKNRRHNIKVGANSLNGLLIKPGEEFSTMKSLGKIDGSTGYLTELVIKDNKTIPEFGGGLCQIGTTMFRAALASGLPITMRRNHSYRVVYYEPAGTDATIYDPWPDFKFINDTANYILIQARIDGDNLYFDFWGTKDGRSVEKTKPTIYNIIKPGPTKEIETTDLKPGEKRCTERAHNGADAYFDYKINYPNGEIKEKRFSSHYVPWQAVCLIGVEKLSEPPAEAESKPTTDNSSSLITQTATELAPENKPAN